MAELGSCIFCLAPILCPSSKKAQPRYAKYVRQVARGNRQHGTLVVSVLNRKSQVKDVILPHHTGELNIRSTLEDSSILKCFFRFSLLMLCLCRKVRDLHMSSCVRITKHKQQQRSCILVQTHTQHKKRVPRAAEAISQVLFSFFIGII